MTKRTPQLEAAILDGFAAGQTISAMCREHGISRSCFQKWRQDPDFRRRYEALFAAHGEAMLDDAYRIAEDPSSDWVGCAGHDPRDLDHLRHARLRIDTRIKIARIYLRRHDARVAAEAVAEREESRREDRLEAIARAREDEADTPSDVEFPDVVSILEEAYRRAERGEDSYVPPPPSLLRRTTSRLHHPAAP